MIGPDEDIETRARECIARFGLLAMFRIEDEINTAVVQRLTTELRSWLRVRACALAILSRRPGFPAISSGRLATAH